MESQSEHLHKSPSFSQTLREQVVGWHSVSQQGKYHRQKLIKRKSRY